jgi:hypothetical protein
MTPDGSIHRFERIFSSSPITPPSLAGQELRENLVVKQDGRFQQFGVSWFGARRQDSFNSSKNLTLVSGIGIPGTMPELPCASGKLSSPAID